MPKLKKKNNKKSKKYFTYYNFYANIKVPLNNIKKGINKMVNKKNNTKKTEVKTPKKSTGKVKNSIIGTMQLFAVASIAYSTVVIAIGTEGIVPLVMIAPQAILAVVIAINKFVK